MDARQTVKISKFLSLVLRHRPGAIGLVLDENGWADVDALLVGCRTAGRTITPEQLRHVVAANDKKRFEFSPDGDRIRASQGHSVEVDLDYPPAVPPEILYHGTAERNLASIRTGGLAKRRRHHVHLSLDARTAAKVGSRHGRSVVLEVRAGQMHRGGMAFYLSANGVWLTDHVPAAYLDIPPRRTTQ